jgi:hypothetical protein
MPIALLAAIPQLILAGLEVAPQIIAAGHIALDALHTGAPPLTEAQRAEIDAAMEAAHRALQEAQPAP